MSEHERLSNELLTFFDDILEKRDPPRDIERSKHITKLLASELEEMSGKDVFLYLSSVTRPLFDAYHDKAQAWPRLLTMAELYLGEYSLAASHTPSIAESLLRHVLVELDTHELDDFFGSIDEWGVFVSISRIILDVSPSLEAEQVFSFIRHFDVFSRGDMGRGLSFGEIKNQLLADPDRGSLAMEVVDYWLDEVTDNIRREFDPAVLDALIEGVLNAPDLDDQQIADRTQWRARLLARLEQSVDDRELQLALRLRCTTGLRGDIKARLAGIVESALRRPDILAEAALVAMTRVSGVYPIEAIEAATDLVEQHPGMETPATRERVADLFARLYSFSLDTLAVNESFHARYPVPRTPWLLIAARSSNAPSCVFVANFLYRFIQRARQDPWHYEFAKSFMREHIRVNAAAVRQPRVDLRTYFPRAFDELNALAQDRDDFGDMTSWLFDFMLDEELTLRTSATKLFFDIARQGKATYQMKLPDWRAHRLEALANQLTSQLIHEDTWIPLLMQIAAQDLSTLQTVCNLLADVALPNYGAESIREHWNVLWPAQDDRFTKARSSLSDAMDRFEKLLQKQQGLPEFSMLSPTVSLYQEVQYKEWERITQEAQKHSFVGLMGINVATIIRGGGYTFGSRDEKPSRFSESSYRFRLPREAMFDPLEERRHFIDMYKTVESLLGPWEEE